MIVDYFLKMIAERKVFITERRLRRIRFVGDAKPFEAVLHRPGNETAYIENVFE